MSGAAHPSFIKTATKLDEIIRGLERRLGVAHKKSSLDELLNKVRKEKNKLKRDEKKKKQATLLAKNKENDFNNALSDFDKLELRVGEFGKVWPHPESEKLYCEELNFGKLGKRSIASGFQKHIPQEKMTGKTVVFMNLKVKKLAGFPSHGMILCSSRKQEDSPETDEYDLSRPDPKSDTGERVFLEGCSPNTVEESIQKPCSSKVLDRVIKRLKTNKEGFYIYNGKKLMTKSGILLKSRLKNATVG